MEIINQYHEIAAIFIARVFLGVLFFFQGYDAVFNIKVSVVIETYQNMFEGKRMPRLLIVLASWFTTCTALFCGFLLILN